MDTDKEAELARIAAELMYLHADAKAVGDPVVAAFVEAAMRVTGDRADQARAAVGEAERQTMSGSGEERLAAGQKCR